MRVLIVNTSEQSGGAAIAARRLTSALNNHGVKAKMLVRDKADGSADGNTAQAFNPTVVKCGHKWLSLWHFLWERIIIFLHMHLKYSRVFQVDIANSGMDITRLREFREADVIHLHWVNQGMLSLAGLRRIIDSGKPVVWTMHDLWPATAICHLTLGCRRFTTACRCCKYLPGGGSNHDLAARVWKRKQHLLENRSVAFVACSRWLQGEAKGSALLRGQTIAQVHNPIDTRLYRPGDKQAARQAEGLPADRLLLLFVCQNVAHANKGMSYLCEACQQLAQKYPDLKDRLTLVVLGSHADEVAGQMPFDVVQAGYVADEQRLIRLYQAADAFVLPSLSENLPNTIMEALACGVPCVGFRVGGIPEMIDHRKNGYVADYRSSDDLARGIWWVLCEADRPTLSEAAVRKVAHTYAQQTVAMRYIEIYQEQMAQKNLKL